ncbi:hypothetical protein BC835DRAFT_1002386 [Cytidiella melzeri]|nr:hypothetical protein BC835DRAFT_1002386 [Cytidiella melzeri]
MVAGSFGASSLHHLLLRMKNRRIATANQAASTLRAPTSEHGYLRPPLFLPYLSQQHLRRASRYCCYAAPSLVHLVSTSMALLVPHRQQPSQGQPRYDVHPRLCLDQSRRQSRPCSCCVVGGRTIQAATIQLTLPHHRQLLQQSRLYAMMIHSRLTHCLGVRTG